MKKSKLTAVKKIFSSKLFILAVLAMIVLSALAAGRQFIKRYQVNREIESLKEEIARQEAGNGELERLIKYLETDFFAEEEGRLKMGLQKPGEQVVVVPDLSGQVAYSNEKEYNENDLINPRKWWNYFFDNQ